MEHVFETIVRSTEVDMIGHLNNAKYLEYMEWGRVDWMGQAGLSLQEIQGRGILPVVVNINVNYRKEVLLGERIKVVSRPLRCGGKSFVIRHELFNQAGVMVCDADATMVMIDAKTRRATVPPEEISRLYADQLSVNQPSVR
ncbi:acyl-CoA thioesterase [Brevibacillus humidisoli]|uniref:acyl-CoA thioesterase n=1 Tax=Brevibacillus humidisoli TaxID=2895522 RepID=UPI001E4F4252|nr:thioesterase family protein [Brevibacillus humidisoli]UFJ41225.1 acyl-CoA thioesterase [Brevibacillus humidisoli]